MVKYSIVRLPWWLSGRESACMQETRVQSLGWEDPLGRKQLPTAVPLPGKSHGHRPVVSQQNCSIQTAVVGLELVP